MSRERWQRIESLFESALEQKAEERARWLESACPDPALRSEVAQMLRAHERAAGVLEHRPLTTPGATPSWFGAPGSARPPDGPESMGRRPASLSEPADSFPDSSGAIPEPGAISDPLDPGASNAISERQDATPDLRETIGPYRVEREIGRGGMGIVHLALDTRLNRRVALKLLPPHLGNDPQARARFRAEARAASGLDHPNICTIYDIGQTEDGREFIAMAFYDGETLSARLERGPLDLESILRISIRIGEGLAAAHEARVVHRDIKPSNIMITRRGETKILDFGVAKLEGGGGLTNPGVPIGTLAYMSPEQIRGGHHVGPPADLWALGVLLYEMSELRRPFQGEHMAAILHAIVSSPPLPYTRTDLPDPLRRLILDLLEKDPARRPDARRLVQRLCEIPLRDRHESVAHAGSESLDRILSPHGSDADGARTREELGALETGVRSLQLPEMLTRFFGREQELAAAHALLHSARLLTLTGPAGTGKTRLSLEIASSMSRAFPDGIFFVPLAAIEDPALVPTAIARALLPEAMLPADPLDAVRRRLADRSALLILDNFEQVVAAAPVVSSILVSCPGVKVLATSRVVLRVSGEHAFAVSPLEVVDPREVSTAGDLGRFPATALFLDRARSADPSFPCDAASARAIAAICERLDGIPLAIELAAARIRSFPPEELLARLAKRLDLLRGGGRDRPSRHQTLRQAIGWSYALLDPWRQRLFAWLSVFSGGFSLDAAERMGSAMGLSGRETNTADEIDIVEAVSDLFDHSLLVRAGHARFGMLETIREFALDRLTESGELANAQQWHSSWMIALAEEARSALTGPDQKEWLDRCDAELENLRAALTRSLENRDAETGLQIAGGIWRFWLARGHLREGRELTEQILRMEPRSPVPPSIRAEALHGVATLCHNQGFNRVAHEWLEEELQIWRDLRDRRGIADALNNLGWVACELTELDTATRLSQEALELGRELEEERTIAVALNNLGWVANYRADHDAAIAAHGENLALRRKLGDRRGIAFALGNLAWAHDIRGEYDAALRLVGEAIAMLADLQDDLLHGFAKSVEGSTRYSMGELGAAREALQRSCELWERVENPSGLGWASIQLARVSIDLEELDFAERCLEKAFEAAQRVGDRAGHSRWHAAAALHQAARGLVREAAENARASLQLRLEIGDRLGLAEATECLALIAARSETADPAWLLAAGEAMRKAHRLPSAWPARRIQEPVRGFLQDRNRSLPDLDMDSITSEELLRHAAQVAGETPDDLR